MFTARQRRVSLALATVTLAATLAPIGGCAVMRDLDAQLARAVNPPTGQAATTQPAATVTPAADPPDPYVEIAAGVAALLGYGGLAAYIRSTKKNGRKEISTLAARVATLEAGTNHKK